MIDVFDKICITGTALCFLFPIVATGICLAFFRDAGPPFWALPVSLLGIGFMAAMGLRTVWRA